MLNTVIAFSGKAGSGKDTYANAVRCILNDYPGRTVQETHYAYCLQTAYAKPLKDFVKAFTGLPLSSFIDRTVKESAIKKDDLERIYNKITKEAKEDNQRRIIISGLPRSKKKEMCRITLDYGKLMFMLNTLERELGVVTPRDLLKIFGAYGGVVPFWSWYTATHEFLYAWHFDSTEHCIILSDLRTTEEFLMLKAFCNTWNIRLISIRLNPWSKDLAQSNHITETSLDNKEQWFTDNLFPEEGEAGITAALERIINVVGIPYNKEIDFSKVAADVTGKIKEQEIFQ